MINHIIAALVALALAGCVPPTGFVAYGGFQEGCTGDRFEVACDWEGIEPRLEEHGWEKYGLEGYSDDGRKKAELEDNAFTLFTHSSYEPRIPHAKITYGAVMCNSYRSYDRVGMRYFPEPMVEVRLTKLWTEDDPPYLQGYWGGYRAVYTLDGELALEEGQWYVDGVDKDRFWGECVEAMLAIVDGRS